MQSHRRSLNEIYHASYGMVAYHFTSLENFEQIRKASDAIYRQNEERANASDSYYDYTDGSENECEDEYGSHTLYEDSSNESEEGEEEFMLSGCFTLSGIRLQRWAYGKHRGKTDIRLIVRHLDFEELELPNVDTKEYARLAVQGAVKKYILDDDAIISCRHYDDYYRGAGRSVWFNGTGIILKAQRWNYKTGRYNEIQPTVQAQIWELMKKIDEPSLFNPSVKLSDCSYWYSHKHVPTYLAKLKKLRDIRDIRDSDIIS